MAPAFLRLLETYLRDGNWRRADEETTRLILSLGGQEGNYLDYEPMESLPREELAQIDRLWTEHSGGRFGFSVQKHLWLTIGELEGAYPYYERFGRLVGWVGEDGCWIAQYPEYSFRPDAPAGHLPTLGSHRSGRGAAIQTLARGRFLALFSPELETRFQAVFGRPRVVLPVLHVVTPEQALRNARIAREAGADGLFLINHGPSWRELLAIHEQVAAAFPDWWVGVNCLDLTPDAVLQQVTDRVSGVWVDNAGIREDTDEQPTAGTTRFLQHQKGWPGLYFGGVAFKYQRPVRDLAAAARNAAPYMDVVTTSGPGTGEAAAVEKIRAMKEALGPRPLAIASGVTPENVDQYLPWADCFLVATGISRSWEEFDPERVAALVRKVHGHSPHSPREGATPHQGFNERLEDAVRIYPARWPGKELEVQPGDLSRIAPMGIGLAGPLPVFPWSNPLSPSPGGYYAYQAQNPHPLAGAPRAEPAGGVVYFDDSPRESDVRALMRLLEVRAAETKYAVFLAEAEDPKTEGYLKQIRIISRFALEHLFHALGEAEYEAFPEQRLSIGDLVWFFILNQQLEWGAGCSDELAGLMGGDGDWATESLAFGFMVENSYHGIYRLWSRAWLVTK